MPWAALAPLIVLVLAFDVFCLYDLRKADVRYMPKWAWAIVIVILNFGGVVYLAVGRRQA